MERTRILVWDLPVRVFHWLLALSFAGAFLTAESERARDLHVALGYVFLGLLAFRLVWGVVGSRHARFTSFAYGPKAVLSYLKSLLMRRPLHYTGHNPAGSWVIYAILVVGILTGTSGYALTRDAGGRWLESMHEATATAMLALVIVHVAGGVIASLMHRENLVAAMVTGYKMGVPSEAIARSRWLGAAALTAVAATLFSVALNVPSLHGGGDEATTQRDAGHWGRSHHHKRDGDG